MLGQRLLFARAQLLRQGEQEWPEAGGAGLGFVRQQVGDLVEFCQPGAVRVTLGQGGPEQRQQAGLGERLDNPCGVILYADQLQFRSQHARRDRLFHLGFAGVGHLHRGAFLSREAQPHAQSHQPQQARGVVVKSIGADGAQFAAFEVRQAIQRVQQQPARGLIERKRNRVAGEIAAAQIFLNGGWRNLRLTAAARVFLLPRHGDLRGGAGGELDLRALAVLVRRNDGGAGVVGHRLGEFQGRALHHEIEIANPETSQHVAHRAAG